MSIKPQYFLYNGNKAQVSDFNRDTRPKDGEIRCLCCNQLIVLALGEKNQHHYRHKHISDSECVVTSSSETAMHFNTKHHIADQLQKLTKLNIEIPCITPHCHNTTREKFIDYDEVCIEYSDGDFIYDIALLKDEKLSAVIEVYVTHETTPKKLLHLKNQKIKLLELQVTPQNYKSLLDWKGNQSIKASFICSSSSFTAKKCNPCLEQLKKDQASINRSKQYAPSFFQRKKPQLPIAPINPIIDAHTSDIHKRTIDTMHLYEQLPDSSEIVERKFGLIFQPIHGVRNFTLYENDKPHDSGLKAPKTKLLRSKVKEYLDNKKESGSKFKIVKSWDGTNA